MPPVVKNNLPLITLMVTLVSGLVVIVLFVAPLRTLPQDLKEVRDVQMVQSEVLRNLAKSADQTEILRRDVDRNTSEIGHIRQSVQKLETRQ